MGHSAILLYGWGVFVNGKDMINIIKTLNGIDCGLLSVGDDGLNTEDDKGSHKWKYYDLDINIKDDPNNNYEYKNSESYKHNGNVSDEVLRRDINRLVYEQVVISGEDGKLRMLLSFPLYDFWWYPNSVSGSIDYPMEKTYKPSERELKMFDSVFGTYPKMCSYIHEN